MSKCNFSPRLFLRMGSLLDAAIASSSSDYSKTLGVFSTSLKSSGIDITEDIIKNFIEASDIDNDIRKKILAGEVSKKEPESRPEDPAEPPTKKPDDPDPDDDTTGVKGVSEVSQDEVSNPTTRTNITSVFKKVEYNAKNSLRTAQDVYDTYFSGNTFALSIFTNNFAKTMFSSSFVSFDKDNGGVIKNTEELNNNLDKRREEFFEDFKKMTPDATTEEDAVRAFKELIESKNINTSQLTNQLQNGDFFAKAYFSFLYYQHFDELIKIYSPNIKINKRLEGIYSQRDKYSLNVSHNKKNNYSDSIVNMMDEMTSLTRSMINYTPLLDVNGKPKFGAFLSTRALNRTVGLLKANAAKTVRSKKALRLNPEQGIREMLINVLNQPHNLNSLGLTTSDFEVIVTVYNYFYKLDSDGLKNTLYKKDNIKSLLQSKQEMLKEGPLNPNVVVDSLTALIDKTISQRNVSIQETNADYRRMISSNDAVDKSFMQVVNNINNLASIANEELVDKYSIINGIVTILNYKINAMGSPVPVTGSFENLDASEWGKFLAGNTDDLNADQIKYAETIREISEILNLGLLDNNAELLLQLEDVGNFEASDVIKYGLNIAAKVINSKSIIGDYNKRVNKEQSLASFAESFISGDVTTSSFVNSNLLTPMNDKANNPFLNVLAYAKTIINGDVSKAVARNRNNDGIPTSTLLNVIGDDETNFQKVKMANPEDAVKSNLFGIGDNSDIVVDTIYRSDFESINGDIKNSKKFNAGEIATQAVFQDALLGIAEDGKGAFEVTTYSDKPGQAMKLVDFNRVIEVNGERGTLLGFFRAGKLNKHYLHTQHGQYKALHNKLIRDYSDIISYIVSNGGDILLNGKKLDISDVDNLTIYDYDSILKQNKIRLEDYSTVTGRRIEIQKEFHYSLGGVNDLLLAKFRQYDVTSDTPNFKEIEAKLKREDKKSLRMFQDNDVNFDLADSRGNIKESSKKLIELFYKLQGKDSVTNDDIDKFLKEWVNRDGTMKLFVSSTGLKLTEEDCYNPSVTVTMNPLIELFLQSNRMIINNYNQAVVGGPHAHKYKPKQVKQALLGFDKKNKAAFKNNKQNFISKYLTLDEIRDEMIESSRTLAMFKRMVAYQAKMHPVMQGSYQGLPYYINMSVIDDVSVQLWNEIGVTQGMDVADGAGFLTMVAGIQLGNSLADMKSDTVTFKAIRHDIDHDSQSAQLDKYALQTMSNQRMRKSEGSKSPFFFLHKRALSTNKISDFLPEGHTLFGSLHSENAKNFIDNPNPILPKFLRNKPVLRNIEGMNQYSELIGISYNSVDGTYTIAEKFTSYAPNEEGVPDTPGYTFENGIFKKTVRIDTIFDIWNLMGGLYTIQEVDYETDFMIGNKFYDYSEDSNHRSSDFLNNVIIQKTPEVMNSLKAKNIKTTEPTGSGLLNQDEYYQPLKSAMIWQQNLGTGMKNGAKNVNKSSVLTTDPDQVNELGEYVNKRDLDYFVTTSSHYGLQGDFDNIYDSEHEADVKESSQMISLIAANGMMSEEVESLYKAISMVVRNGISKNLKALEGVNDDVLLMLTKQLIRTLADKDDISLANSYIQNVKAELSQMVDKEDYDKLVNKIPFSDANFYSAMVSMISGAINSTSINRRVSGFAGVLAPAFNQMMVQQFPDGSIVQGDYSIKLYKKKLFDLYKNEIKAGNYENYQKALNEYINGFRNNTLIENYTISSFDTFDHTDSLRVGDYVFEISGPDEYYNIKTRGVMGINGVKQGLSEDSVILPNGQEILKTDAVLLVATHGIRNLKSRRLVFTGSNGEVFNEMDFLGAKLLHAIKSKDNAYQEELKTYKELKKLENISNDQLKIELINFLQDSHQRLQETGEFIHSINNEGQYLISQGSSRIEQGEMIAPAIYKHKFGLTNNVELKDVSKDFFLERLRKATKDADKKADFVKYDINGKQYNYLNEHSWDRLKDSGVVSINNKFIKTDSDGNNVLLDSYGDTILIIQDGMKIFTTDSKGDPSKGTVWIQYGDNYDQSEELDYFIYTHFNFNNLKKRDLNSILPTEFDELIDKGLKNNTKEFTALQNSIKARDLTDKADQMILSWNAHLEMLGARIPSQALQSVMGLKIVGFTEDGLNTSYVPIKKNWLDGSDSMLESD